MKNFLLKLGPGFLFAGAAIGVSHLVQSTRAGAEYGLGLIWALLLINIIKYPFFYIGTKYAAITGKNLLQAFSKMPSGVLIIYFMITLATMFTIQTAVTIVTAGIAATFFGFGSVFLWTVIILLFSFILLVIGKYKLLDNFMKYVVITLTISTLFAVAFAFNKVNFQVSFQQIIPENKAGLLFLIAFMGWMPAPLDISIWQSIWVVEKQKLNKELTQKQLIFDFNTGYITTILLGIAFVLLGYFVLYNTNTLFFENSTQFANQLIGMYTTSLGEWATYFIAFAALATMFSTSLTTLDGSPRVMRISSKLIFNKPFKEGYLFWLIILVIGTLAIYLFFAQEMGLLIKLATVLSFITAPFYAFLNFKAINHPSISKNLRPSKLFNIFSALCIIILIVFTAWYISTLF